MAADPSNSSDLDYADTLWKSADSLGRVYDPAAGSGGLFVQSWHFLQGQTPALQRTL